MATLISFSGGETSAYMTIQMLENPTDEYVIVFANTGEEREETLEFVHKVEQYIGQRIYWVEAFPKKNVKGVPIKIVDFESASRNGEPFEAMIAKFGIPNQGNPNCSRTLKKHAIQAFARGIGWRKYFTAIGIRIDEPKRLNWKTAKKERLIYPLATQFPTTKPEINRFWSRMPFRLNLKSYEGNCKVCWKKSLRKLMTIAEENPQHFDFFKRMEQEYEMFIPETKLHNEKIKPPIRFFRENMSVQDIFDEASFGFTKAVDESKDTAISMSIWDTYLDTNLGCVESCEVF